MRDPRDGNFGDWPPRTQRQSVVLTESPIGARPDDQARQFVPPRNIVQDARYDSYGHRQAYFDLQSTQDVWFVGLMPQDQTGESPE